MLLLIPALGCRVANNISEKLSEESNSMVKST
jgi:hypothetical protein